MSVVDAYIVASLGAEALAGVTLVFPLVMLAGMMSAGGMGGGVSSAVARALGAGRRPDADALVTHATVLAGVHVGEQGMVGAVAVATKDVRPYHVNVGIPAKSVRVKPNAPASAFDRLRTSVERKIDDKA